MRKILLSLGLAALLCATPAWSQVRPEIGGTGSLTNTGTDDTVVVGDGNSFEESAMPNCVDSGANVITYTASTNTFACGDFSNNAIVVTADWDFGGGGIEVENGTTPPACTEGQLFVDTDATSGQRLMACEGTTFVAQGAGGSGDVTDVGPMYSTGAAFTDGVTTTGTEFLVIEGVTANLNEYHFAVPAADPASDITYTFPSTTGTLVHSTDNIATATALAANPTDCSANQFANAIVASGNLTCAAIADADVPNTITIDLAATATALAANGGNCSAGSFPLGVDASGAAETCTAVSARVIIDEDAGASLLYDGADKIFTLANTPGSCDAVQIVFNGYALKKVATATNNNEFSCSGSTITLALAPNSGDHVQASYTL